MRPNRPSNLTVCRKLKVECLEKGETLLKEKQKHILLADKWEFGWATVHEHKKSEIADDSDDEKKKDVRGGAESQGPRGASISQSHQNGRWSCY